MSIDGSTHSTDSIMEGSSSPMSPLSPLISINGSQGLAVSLLRDLENFKESSPVVVSRAHSNSIESRTGSGLDISSSSGRHRNDSGGQLKKLDVGAPKEFVTSSGHSTDTDETNDDMDVASSVDGQERRGLVDHFARKRSGEESLGKGVVNALKKYLEEQDSTQPAGEGFNRALFAPVAAASASSSEGPKSTMRVKYSKVAHSSKQPKWLYPFDQLKTKKVSYRGYPVEGPDALKKSKKWKIQVVCSALGAPPEPLPQFPQQELLAYSPESGYHGVEKMALTEEQVAWNSGQKYLELSTTPIKGGPTSKSFYTSGYHRGSAVEIMKPFPESIYHTVVSGSAVEVPSYPQQAKNV